jgi:ElaB/YqjD/DUF883 family membrane-anchored ribosome-binding protein
MLENASKMEEIINETEDLIETLEKLNNEIESYQVAKNNLIDVKEKFNQFIDQSSETLRLTKDNFINVNNILNSDLISKLNNIHDGLKKITSDMNDNFIGINDMLNSDLIPELGNLQNGLEKITLDINGKINTLTVELTKFLG